MRSKATLWSMALALLALAAGSQTNPAGAAAPPATTLNDLCPGTPDPCVVTGKFIVPRYVEFDAGGRQFIMKPGSSLTGLEAQVIGTGFKDKMTAPFAITNAASIHLEKGSSVSSPVHAVRFDHHYICPPRTGIVAATRPFAQFPPLEGGAPNFDAFSTGGTHQLNWTWTHDVEPSEAPTLTSWGLEVCSSSSGCVQYMSTDVPKVMSVSFALGQFRGGVTSSLTLPAIPDVVRVRVIDVVGTAPPYNPYNPSFGGSESYMVLNGVKLTERGAVCNSDGNEDFHWSEIRDPTDFYGIMLQSTGGCTIDGKLSAKCQKGALYPAKITVECDGVTIGSSAKIEVKKPGHLVIDGGAGGVSIAEKAKLDVSGTKLFLIPGIDVALRPSGGKITIGSTGACQIGGKLLAQSPLDIFNEEVSNGGGGQIDISCGSVSVLPKTKMVSGLKPAALGSRLHISANSGAVHVAEKAVLMANGMNNPSGGLVVTAKERCTVDGRAHVNGGFPDAPFSNNPLTFVCKGFELGPKATLEARAFHLSDGSINIDTTGATTGEPPADCLIRGELLSNGVFGGHIQLDCGTTLSALPGATISANGTDGGYVELSALGNVTVGGAVTADASGRESSGGAVSIEGCNVTVTEDGRVTTNKGGGNTLKAHDTLQIEGRVWTTLDDGMNTLVYRNAVSILNPSLIVPSTTPVQDLGLSPCP